MNFCFKAYWAFRETCLSLVAITFPVKSWVSVVTPKRMPARYSFELSGQKSTALVAFLTNMGRTPYAIGSRVPP